MCQGGNSSQTHSSMGLVYLPTLCLYGYKLVGKYASPMDCEISDTVCFLLSLGDLQILPRIVPKKHPKNGSGQVIIFHQHGFP